MIPICIYVSSNILAKGGNRIHIIDVRIVVGLLVYKRTSMLVRKRRYKAILSWGFRLI